ncbi:MAG: hypothetical protein ACK4RV_01360 [Caulobacter sp.]|jgi:ABC-type glycerol-3-phosphate transport system substrate-binding protein
MKRTLLAGLAAGLMLFGASSTYAAPPPGNVYWWTPFTEMPTLITISGFIASTIIIRQYVHDIRVGPYGGQ